MRRSEAYLSNWEMRPFEKGDSAACTALLIRVKQVSVMNIILIHGELDSTKAKDFRVESPVDFRVRGYKCDVMETLDETLVLLSRTQLFAYSS